MTERHSDHMRSRIDSLVAIAQNAHQAVAGIDGDAREPHVDGLDRLEEIMAYTAVVLEQTDGLLISDATFQTLSSALTKIQDQMATQPQAADSWADEVLDVLVRMPAARDQDLAQAVKEAAASFQRSAAQRLRTLEGEVGDVQVDVTNLEGKLVEARTEVDTAFAERRAEADKLVSEMRAAVEESKARIDSVETEQRDLFRTAQEERSDAFRQQTEEALTAFKADHEKAAESAEQVVERMGGLEQTTRDLVGVIGDIGTGGRYGLEVKAQKRQADIWRWLTVVVVAVAAGVAFWAANHADGGADDPTFISKVLITVLLGGLATYTARQSSRHRQREESARALELDMAAFPAFIEQLDPEKQQAARELMLQVSFGRPLVPPDHRGDGGPSLFERLASLRSRGSSDTSVAE